MSKDDQTVIYLAMLKGGMKMQKKLVKLFISMFYLSAFTFGGGYVIVTLMRKKFVDEYHWIDEDEMLDLVAIAQAAPGAIAVNGAIVVGYKIAGILGIIVSIMATILPPFFIISVISVFYQLFKDNLFIVSLLDGMQAGVGAVICVVVVQMASGVLKLKNPVFLLIMLAAFIANYFLRINVIFIILVCILLGTVYSLMERGHEK